MIRSEINEAVDVLNRMLDALLVGPYAADMQGYELRRQVGALRADVTDLIDDHALGTNLQLCFDQARVAGATLNGMDRVRRAMLLEQCSYPYGSYVQVSGITFALVEQAKIISKMTFRSRNDAKVMIVKMGLVIEETKTSVAELLDSMNYQSIISLSASIMQHLAVTERQLPRILDYVLKAVLPSLTLANLFYADATRSNEIVEENYVVHPLFCPRQLVVLSK